MISTFRGGYVIVSIISIPILELEPVKNNKAVSAELRSQAIFSIVILDKHSDMVGRNVRGRIEYIIGRNIKIGRLKISIPVSCSYLVYYQFACRGEYY